MIIEKLLDATAKAADDFPIFSVVKAVKQFAEGESEEGAATFAKAVARKTLFGNIFDDDGETPNDVNND